MEENSLSQLLSNTILTTAMSVAAQKQELQKKNKPTN
jgi:hypothetical protein